jgi:hypothetical protein
MKSQLRVAMLSALVLTSPLLSFAAGQHLIRVPSNEEMQDRSGITRAVQYGKGTGVTRNQEVSANAFREQTAAESQVVKEQPKSENSNLSDKALRK